jgi:hypothetical protein
VTHEVLGIRQVSIDSLSATDLRAQALADDEPCEAYRVELVDQAQAIEVLLFPGALRAGISWGSNADWTDVSCAGVIGVMEAVRRYFDGEMIP